LVHPRGLIVITPALYRTAMDDELRSFAGGKLVRVERIDGCVAL
jgi:hypothetical protein